MKTENKLSKSEQKLMETITLSSPKDKAKIYHLQNSFILAVWLCGINGISKLRKKCLFLVNELLCWSKSFWFNCLLPGTVEEVRGFWWHSFTPALNSSVCKEHTSSLPLVKGEWTCGIQMIKCLNQRDIKGQMPSVAYM